MILATCMASPASNTVAATLPSLSGCTSMIFGACFFRPSASARLLWHSQDVDPAHPRYPEPVVAPLGFFPFRTLLFLLLMRFMFFVGFLLLRTGMIDGRRQIIADCGLCGRGDRR